MNKNFSITSKLTILFSIILTCSVLVIGLYSYYNVWALLYKNNAEHLRARAKPIINRWLFNSQDSLYKVAPFLAKDLTSKITSAIIIDKKCKIIGRGKVLPEEPAPAPLNFKLIKRALNGEKEITYRIKIKKIPLLVVLIPLKRSAWSKEIVGVAQISTSLLPIYKIIYKYGIMLIIISFVVLFLGGILSYYLILKSLVRLSNMATVCQKVSEGDFTNNLNDQVNDEIGIVARAFDDMIDKVKNMIDSQKRFVANAAHELRTPLSAIKCSCELLLRGAQDDPASVSKIAKVMFKEINRLINLCEKLLGLTKLDTSFQVNLKKINIEKFLNYFLTKAKLLANNRNIIFKKNKPAYILADEDILNQILIDIFSNAINFTDDNGKITIGWEIFEDYIDIFVEDNGIGIKEDELEKIFEPFYRSGDKKFNAGAGLGLTLVKAMVEANNGKIFIKSKIGKGTKVFLRFKKLINI